jgi:chaperone BCS1
MQYLSLPGFQDHTMLASMLGLWGAAMLTFVSKDIPLRVWRAIQRQFTTVLEVTSAQEEFVAITRWMERRPFSKKVRSIRAKDKELSVGFGRHYFFHQKRLCWFERGRVETKDGSELEEIAISCIGRDQQFLRNIVNEAVRETHQSQETKIYLPRWRSWNLLTTQSPRSMDSVILEDEVRGQIIQHFDRFFDSEAIYRQRGIPYRTGICLYGAPGTGKTSLVRAICAQFNLRLYTVDLRNTNDQDLMELLWRVGTRSLVLMEDIDSVIASHDRSKAVKGDDSERVTLSGLLNAIDGVVASEGRVFAFTTNHIAKIDPALLRPGRVDLKIELGVMSHAMLDRSLRKFLPEIELPFGANWRSDVTPAEFHQLVLQFEYQPERLVRLLTITNEKKLLEYI